VSLPLWPQRRGSSAAAYILAACRSYGWVMMVNARCPAARTASCPRCLLRSRRPGGTCGDARA